MRFGSVCSGIESASVAWEPLGMSAAWFAEIEAFPSAVLAHHWPLVPNVGDMCNLSYLVGSGLFEAPDILVGGTPCQSFSVAGLRKGLDDSRGQLTIEYVRVLDAIDKQRGPGNEAVCVWENVPGVLSDKTNAFGCFLGALAGEDEPLLPTGKKWSNAGYVLGPQRTIAWRILDAQYFGVAQRRRRVFVVASARDSFDPRRVLFESEGLRRDIKPSREAGQGNPRAISIRTSNTGGNGWGVNLEGPTPTLDASGGGFVVATTDPARTLLAKHNSSHDETRDTYYPDNGRFRVATAVERERLQGFPDNHTLVPYRGKSAEQCPDGPRYTALGNSKAVPVVQWVGRRLLQELNK